MREITIRYAPFHDMDFEMRMAKNGGAIVEVLIDGEPVRDLEYFKTEFTPDEEPIIIIGRKMNMD